MRRTEQAPDEPSVYRSVGYARLPMPIKYDMVYVKRAPDPRQKAGKDSFINR